MKHLLLSVPFLCCVSALSRDLEPIASVELQPLIAQAKRVRDALEYVGSPLSADEVAALESAFEKPGREGVIAIQKALASRVLCDVHINPESRVKVAQGPAKPELMQQDWRSFLVRVHNEGGVTAKLRVSSPNSKPLHTRSRGAKSPKLTIKPSDVGNRWADIDTFDSRPLNQTLSGLDVEYRVLEIYSRDVGKREAKIGFDVGQGTQDLGFRNEVDILFDCIPAVEVVLDVRDYDGSPTSGSFVVRDARGRVYPAPSRRLAPDFFFHAQVYRAAGETLMLAPGKYTVNFGRGPEYLSKMREIDVPEGVKSHREVFQLERWVHPKLLGWYSGDHHIHAAGCSHYESPTEGVTPSDMMRHILGEDLNVGCVLTWGPCWYFQKQFFEGDVSALSKQNYLMRYDVEVSGFPSDHTGHLCLLRLKEDDYPGTKRTEDWPSWGYPILEWGSKQGGVVGYSHSGWGLAVETAELPNYVIPPFDSIGANEYIASVTTGVVDFISSVDTPYVWELNIWYHTLNCGFRTRLSGETDFPCIYGERVGLGRVYCKLDGPLDFDKFCRAIRAGRSYVGDGRSHIIDFRVGDRDVGTEDSELRLDRPGTVNVSAKIAAFLQPEPLSDIRQRHYSAKPYWHVERARVGETRRVPVELVVNGQVVQKRELLADGTLREMSFDVSLDKSSWVALRILASCHTNPVFVLVDGKPIRASKKSAQWCIDSVDRCWSQKKRGIRAAELGAAKKLYDSARGIYRSILSESADDRDGEDWSAMIEIATFVSEPERCEYLHDRHARLVYRAVADVSAAEYSRLLGDGWRRFGSLIFRPMCASCRECIPIRVLVDQFRASKSQRRILKRNADVTLDIGEPRVDLDRLQLHDRFHRMRATSHGWSYRPSTEGEYFDSFVANAAPTLEFSYRLDGRLVAVAYVGNGEDGLNSIYAFWDPDESWRGLGNFDVLREIEVTRELGKPYLYLGFLVSGCRSLEYKATFRPHQTLENGAWRYTER